MELGKKQMLTVVKVVDFGVYLGDDREKVLLPKKQVPAGIEPGDPIEGFLYKDSSDRLIATEAYTGGKCNTEGSAGWQIRCLPGLGTGKGFVPAI